MGYSMHHKKARLLFRRKRRYGDGEIIEMRAWLVPRSPTKPEGIKYSLVYIDASGRRILGYDNADGKGHHRHVGDAETPSLFVSLEALTLQFLDEVDRLRGRHQ